MTTSTYRISPDDLKAAKTKAGLIPLGTIVRILVLKWLRGEIEISPEDQKMDD